MRFGVIQKFRNAEVYPDLPKVPETVILMVLNEFGKVIERYKVVETVYLKIYDLKEIYSLNSAEEFLPIMDVSLQQMKKINDFFELVVPGEELARAF